MNRCRRHLRVRGLCFMHIVSVHSALCEMQPDAHVHACVLTEYEYMRALPLQGHVCFEALQRVFDRQTLAYRDTAEKWFFSIPCFSSNSTNSVSFRSASSFSEFMRVLDISIY